jgi:anti-sigma factor RsiW
MSDHVIEWLNAYLDGELRGKRLHQVEEHLAGCTVCRAELEGLQNLSDLLHKAPPPEFTTPDRFAAQVNLLLPQQRRASTGSPLLEAGWWMLPVGILAVWVFISTAILLSNVVSAADSFGLLDRNTAAWIAVPSERTEVTSTLGQFGMLNGSSLQWAEATENVTRNAWPLVVLHVSAALLYLAWFAIWWARHRRHPHQPQVPLLES